MSSTLLLVFMGIVLAATYVLGRGRSLAQASNVGGTRYLNSLPFYYGMITVLWAAIPALILLGLWYGFDDAIIQSIVVQHLPEEIRAGGSTEIGLALNKIRLLIDSQYVGEPPVYMAAAAEEIQHLNKMSQNLLTSVIFMLMLVAGAVGYFRINPQMKARLYVENWFKAALLLCSLIAILTTLGIVLSVLLESIKFFKSVPITEFLFGLEWSPQNAMRADQVMGSSSFGAIPLFAGTLLIAFISMLIAVPVGLMSAIYLADYAPARVRNIVKPLLEILAGIPTVVYGFFAALTVAPMIRDLALAAGLGEYMNVTSESALAVGLIMGVMIVPFVSSLSDDVINAVPQSLRDGALALGATKSEVVKQVVIPAALPGIVGGFLLAVSRAIGETMIVVMAAGLAANLTANPLDSVTTVTVQIVTLLTGDQEFDSPKTLAAFALGLMLFIVTLALNYIALHVVKKYREQYE